MMNRKVDASLQGVKKYVYEALQLDSNQKHELAYVHYLECLKMIISSLHDDAKIFGVQVTPNNRKCIKLGQQCMERLILLMDLLPIFDEGGNLSCPESPLMPPSSSIVSANEIEQNTYLISPSVRITKQTVPARYNQEMTPIECAQFQNQKLLAAYQARLARARNGSAKLKLQVDLNLSLQRKLAENMAIAKAREQTLTRKINERHQRLQNEALRRFNDSATMSKEELDKHRLFAQVLEYEKSHQPLVIWRQNLDKNKEETIINAVISLVLSMKDHPLTLLLVKYQCATQDKLKPLVEKYRIEEPQQGFSCSSDHRSSSPVTSAEVMTMSEDPAVKRDACDEVLSGKETTTGCENIDSVTSKMTNSMCSSTRSEYETITIEEITQLETEALGRHLQNIVADVHDFIDKILSMFMVIYESVASPTGKDICYAMIEEHFFLPIWEYLIALYRIVHRKEENKLALVFEKYKDCDPQVLEVSKQYQLVNEVVPTKIAYPYEPAVNELKNLAIYNSPLAKLECIVQVSRLICKCVEDYYMYVNIKEQHAIPRLGADDLLPVLGFVIVRSGLTSLPSECHALEEFIYEGYLIGEEGYCLTSLQTALSYVLTLAVPTPH